MSFTMGVEQVNQDVNEIIARPFDSIFSLYINLSLLFESRTSQVRFSALLIFDRCKYLAILGQRELEIEQR